MIKLKIERYTKCWISKYEEVWGIRWGIEEQRVRDRQIEEIVRQKNKRARDVKG